MDADSNPGNKRDAYERHKDRSRARQSEQSEQSRDIGSIPPIENQARRDASEWDFQQFLEVYFANAFQLEWSEDHIKMIKAVETAVLTGGLQAIAMPRGTGKTTICERAVIWAVVFGHCNFVLLVAADKTKSEESLAKIQMEMETNELLVSDFPEVCVPIQALEGLANRCKGQLCQGKRTYIRYGKSILVCPSIDGSTASGSIIKVGGIKSAVRGANHGTREGEVRRPNLVLIDDPQTRDSASSPKQCDKREQIVSADILGCAAPGKSIAALMTVTVIYRDDMADRILNRHKHPGWRGLRCKLLYELPARMDLWEQYWQLRCEELIADGDGSVSTEFYRDQQAEMDRGSKVAWPQRFKEDEISALQFAMNLFFADRTAFFSEFQNDPEDETTDSRMIEADELALKLNGLLKSIVPAWAHMLTAFIDVHEDLLYWGVLAIGDGFTSSLITYGCWPPQAKKYFLKRQARPDLITWFAKETGRPAATVSMEEALYAGLEACTNLVFAGPWIREDKAPLAVRRLMVDASHGPTSTLVKSFCASSPHKDSIWASHGVGINKRAMFKPSKAAKEKGDRFGHYWRLSYSSRRQNIAHLSFDANYWKTFLWSRLRVSLGGAGCLSFFGEWATARAGGESRPRIKDEHKLLIEHIRAESPSEKDVGDEKVEIWTLDPNQENHLYDVLVGCLVGASFEGLSMAGHQSPAAGRKRKKYSLGRNTRKEAS